MSEPIATAGDLTRLLNPISLGVLLVQPSGDIIAFNEFASEILDMPQEKVVLNNYFNLFPDDLFGFSMKEALASEQSPGTVFVTLANQKAALPAKKNNEPPNGAKAYSPGEGSPVRGDAPLGKKELAGIADQKELEVAATFIGDQSRKSLTLIIRDVTEIHRLQRIENRHGRLEELGEMAAMLAHEIRNPLGGIEGFASLLHRDLENAPELQKMASQIIDGTRALNHLVSKVLHYARPLKLQLASKDLVALGKEVLEAAKADAALSNHIQFQLEASDPSIYAAVDEELLKTAILNLVVNGVQAMPGGGNLLLKVAKEPKFVAIEVSDTGSGILPENRKKIFSPFFTTKEEGNGLGLAEVQKVVQAHGGHISLKSGKGAAFTIHLPYTNHT